MGTAEIQPFAILLRSLSCFCVHPLSSFPLLNFVTILGYANFIRHPTLGRASSGQLFRHDETCHRVAGKRRSLLFHRRLSFDDLTFRSCRPTPEYSGCRTGLSCLRPGSEKGGFFPP